MLKNRVVGTAVWVAAALVLAAGTVWGQAAGGGADPSTELGASGPVKVYVPYDKLRDVFNNEKQGVFLPYDEFQKLWAAAQGKPAGAETAPAPWLISASRFTGRVGPELATMRMELTVDILADGWVQVPIGLGEVAVTKVAFAGGEGGEGSRKDEPLLRLVESPSRDQQKGAAAEMEYVLVTRGRGRVVLQVDFVRQLVTQPGLHVLRFRTPPAAISTLELVIPEENMKVDVAPMLAATTGEATADGKKVTRLQAFLGNAAGVELSWKPRTEAAEELEPVVIAEQLQHIHVDEAVITRTVDFTYDIRRRGVEKFVIQVDEGWRITSVEGANVAKWDVAAPGGAPPALTVALYSPMKDSYTLRVQMERFVQEDAADVPIGAIRTQGVLRRSGLIAISHSPRRSVTIRDEKNLARVDVGRLPPKLRQGGLACAYRFITDHSATLAVDTVSPRVAADHRWSLAATGDRLTLQGRLSYTIERTGVFQLAFKLPDAPIAWELLDIGPRPLVDDFQIAGQGPDRTVTVLLNQRITGNHTLTVSARAPRPAPDAAIRFVLPTPDPTNLHTYQGQLVLLLADNLQAEPADLRQLTPLPLGQATALSMPGVAPAVAYQFRAIDRARPAGADFKITVKPTQVTAVAHRLVNIQPDSIVQEVVLQYSILYASIDKLYVAVPAGLPDADIKISGADIREKQRLTELPVPAAADAPGRPAAPAATMPDGPAPEFHYYKIVLQAPVIGGYQLTLTTRSRFQPAPVGEAKFVTIDPILVAGELAGQTGFIAIAKDDTLAIGKPEVSNLTEGDPTSPADLPWEPHRQAATLAFRYSAPPFKLTLPVVAQKEAAVYTMIATGVLVEQVVARDGQLKTRVVYMLSTSRGSRVAINLPEGYELYGVLVNGLEAGRELDAGKALVIRLPHSSGQIARYIVEVSYGLKGASARHLPAPALVGEVPVQQTLWRVSVPTDDLVLAHSRDASLIGEQSARDLLERMSSGYPSFEFRKWGDEGVQLMHLVRQGAPGEMSVWSVRSEWFKIGVWVAIVALGLLLIPASGVTRLVLVVLAMLGGLIIHLYAPILARHIFNTGWPAGLLVLLLWFGHWLLRLRGRPGGPPVPTPATAGATTTGGEIPVPYGNEKQASDESAEQQTEADEDQEEETDTDSTDNKQDKE